MIYVKQDLQLLDEDLVIMSIRLLRDVRLIHHLGNVPKVSFVSRLNAKK